MTNKLRLIALILLSLSLSCGTKNSEDNHDQLEAIAEPEPNMQFGFDLNKYVVKNDTIKNGESFGLILQRNNIGYPDIYNIVEKSKDTFDIRKLQAGKPYTLLCSNDSIQKPVCFIYQPNITEYVVIRFEDSIHAYKETKPITIRRSVASAAINDEFSNISDAMYAQNISNTANIINEMSDIYAWTINFFKLQKGDEFKIIYRERFIDDTISAGIEKIDAAYFKHRDREFYAFNYTIDSTKNITDYFDEQTNSLRKTFLTSPVKFSRISSRYNLKRRIAYYGNKIRPHLGTDFAAPIGTEILATANGVVVESTRKGGNGKYVKIKHNDTYSTQYLHMSKQAVKKGQYVKQGDVIGYVGMTGNTSGPHVCYRFWKNGKQVDPFREKLPEAEKIPENLKADYLKFIQPIKVELDNIAIPKTEVKSLDEKKNFIS
jgi:murein DD-endopeptidase MepM/ murein hydrolase activator NlpD